MESTNSFQLLNDAEDLIIDRFHICTWEFENRKPLIEFGIDINKESIKDHVSGINFSLYIPWDISAKGDLSKELSIDDNSKFIFNDSIKEIHNLNNDKDFGVIHEFEENGNLTILPVSFIDDQDFLKFNVDLSHCLKDGNKYKTNIYCRFWLMPKNDIISIKRKGIAKTNIIYDIKVNERRNVPSTLKSRVSKLKYPKIKNCYCFNIIPSDYDIIFYENKALKNVRNLEYDAFRKYLTNLIADKKISLNKNELLVVFNKKQEEDSTYSFFSIYNKELFGLKQVSIVILLNIICSFLFFLPSFRGKEYNFDQGLLDNLKKMPFELYLIVILIATTCWYVFGRKRNSRSNK